MKRNKKWFSKWNIAEGINRYHSVNGILNHYIIRCDPYIGLRRFSIIRIPGACINFRNSMDLTCDPYLVPKDQIIYCSVTKWKYYPILGKQNDWEIMYFI